MLVGKPLARVHLKDRREGKITLRHISERERVFRVGAGVELIQNRGMLQPLLLAASALPRC